MNSIHDMGGMHGFGPVKREDNEPVFHEEWEGRVLGMMMTMSGHLGGNIDNSRHRSESLPPADYLRLGYYEKWFVRMERACIEADFISHREIDDLLHDKSIVSNNKLTEPVSAETLVTRLKSGRLSARPIVESPAFKVGESIRARNINPVGHTRLPRYARGKIGIVFADHGGHVFPDTNACFEGENPQRLYTVLFSAQALWGKDKNPKDTVCIDLWESYLEAI